jgi:hypothetical protein
MKRYVAIPSSPLRTKLSFPPTYCLSPDFIIIHAETESGLYLLSCSDDGLKWLQNIYEGLYLFLLDEWE